MKTNQAQTATQITIKALIVGAMILVMLIPVAMLQSMIRERMRYQQEVETEIGSTWGGPQTVTGPILALPYERTTGDGEKKTTEKGTAYYLPDTLNIQGGIETEVRSRTAHKVLLYRSELALEGRFSLPDLESQGQGLRPEHIRWNEAYLYIGITSLQGVQSSLSVEWGNDHYADAAPINNDDLTGTGFSVRVPVGPEAGEGGWAIPFRFDLNLNGTGSLFFAPVGKETFVHLKSPWKTVSFSGNYLPSERDLTDGFSADWKIFDFNRSYPQAWKNDEYALGEQEYDADRGDYTKNSPVTRSAFGVDLRFPLDHYQLSIRSVKYAVMFIALTFFVFFLAELLSHRRIHPIQYLLVSCGLVLFYSLLLALSEHIGFDWAYLASAVAIVALITAYSASIFKSSRLTIRMALFLSALYVYLYVMLQLEDMALLFGSIGLFLALAIIMYVSRKVSWYKTGEPLPEKPADSRLE
jgi:inner membrane protein